MVLTKKKLKIPKMYCLIKFPKKRHKVKILMRFHLRRNLNNLLMKVLNLNQNRSMRIFQLLKFPWLKKLNKRTLIHQNKNCKIKIKNLKKLKLPQKLPKLKVLRKKRMRMPLSQLKSLKLQRINMSL